MGDEELRHELVARAPVLAEVAIHREGAHVYELARAHAERYVAGSAVIIGDAAHSTNPTAGQGMTMALGDAGALADLAGPALERGERDLGTVLAAYEARRWPLNEKLVRGSHRLARLYALRGSSWNRVKLAAARALASPLGRLAVNPVLQAFLQDTETKGPARPRRAPIATAASAQEAEPRFDEGYEDADLAAGARA
jgi:2-polyprenyl-6-methoxyphenol hydroxylase-like FAD-dependent oxidoreductase